MRKRTVCLILTILMMIGFFHQSIISSTFSLYLKGYCRTCWSGELSYQNLYRENGVWIIEKPIFTTWKKLQNGGHRLTAERLEIDLSLLWKELTLDINFFLSKSRIDIGKGSNKIRDLFKSSRENLRSFRIQTHFLVPEGLVVMHDFSSTPSLETPIYFDVDLHCEKEKEGCISIGIKPRNGEKPFDYISVNFSSSDSQPSQIAIHANDVDCRTLMQGLKTFWDENISCELTKGRLSGNITFTNHSYSSSYAEGSLFIDDLTLRHPFYGLECRLPRLSLTLDQDKQKKILGASTRTTASIKTLQEGSVVFSREHEPFQTIAKAGMTGSFSLDLAANDPWTTTNADLKIADGGLPAEGYDRTKWQFVDLKADLSIRNGVVQKSMVKGEVAGLKGEIEIDGNFYGDIVKCRLSGLAIDLAKAIPGGTNLEIEKRYSRDRVEIVTILNRQPQTISATGQILIGDDASRDELNFAFDLQKADSLDTCPSSLNASDHMDQKIRLKNLSNANVQALLECNLEQAAQQLNIGGFVIRDGWFEGKNLRLEKYVSPYLFSKNQMQLSGLGDFYGSFDTRRIAVRYHARDFALENSDFVIEVKSIERKAGEKSTSCDPFHYFDLQKMYSTGTIPISNATYFEKNTGLLFTDINAVVTLEDGLAYLSNVETFCNGIFFSGDISLDWSMPGEGIFEVDISSHEMQGNVSQIQHLFSHFNKNLFFLKLPVDGNVVFCKGGGRLRFSFYPGDYDLQATFQGKVNDGTFFCQTADLSLQELSLNFDYNHQANTLEFSDIQGTLLVGKPGYVEEYSVAGEHIRFTNYAKNEALFDLWIGDKKRDLIRLAGSTRTHCLPGKENEIEFIFDNDLSHFGDVHPSSLHLIMRDWSQINQFSMEFDFHLKTLLHDLQRFSRTGLLFLSRSLLDELNELKAAEGYFKVDLCYGSSQDLLTYNATATDVIIGSHHFQQLLLNGRKKGSTWTIDQLQFDEINLAADLVKEEDRWKLNFLGVRVGKSLLLGLEGEYDASLSILEAKVNLLEADLAHLDEWPLWRKTIREYGISGLIRANGLIRIDFDRTLPQGRRLNVQMNVAVRSPCFKGIVLKDIENTSIHYISDKDVTIRGLNTAFKAMNTDLVLAQFSIQNANFNFVQREFMIDGLSFRIPAENLGWFADNLQQSFSNILSQSFIETIRQLKRVGEVSGSMKIDISHPHCGISLMLDDGVYVFMDREYDLREFALEYDPFELKISSQYRYKNLMFWLTARSSVPALNSGEIVLSQLFMDPDSSQKTSPLSILWQIDPIYGFSVQRLEGSICGLNLNLCRDAEKSLSDDRMFFVGEVAVNMTRAHELLDDDIAAKLLEWKIGRGYALKGKLLLFKDSNKPISESLSFQGALVGRDFEFYGYNFQSLSAQIVYTPDTLNIKKIFISDTCGNLQVNEMLFAKQANGGWNVHMPLLTMNDFRPCQLRYNGPFPPSFSKTLLIREFDVRDFHSALGHANSCVGKGRILFANPPKKNLQHTIFAIPAEILTRLGLDLAVLNPIRGVIFYDMGNGKIALTKFKDVYSKGRLSKFYLPNTGFQSYIDFDGNLNIQVRMKQYNIFFKLAELFTVTVQGTLSKPIYSLQKMK